MRQDGSLLIGSPEAIDRLAGQDEATILAISDSHGASRTVVSILRSWGEQSDALVFCGDGAGDICHCLSEAADDEGLSRCLPPVIALVQGNNDAGRYHIRNSASAEAHPSFTDVAVPLTQTLTAAGHALFITHGHRFSLYNGTGYLAQEAMSVGAQAVLYGHTHIAMAECSFGIFTFNPGSCACPRGGLPPSFMTLTLKKGSAFFDNTFYRISGSQAVPFNPNPMRYY